MMSAPLPPALEYRLAALGNRVRRLRVVRGACWVVLVALLAGSGLVLIDVMFRPPMWIRCVGQVGWIGMLGVLSWRSIVRPWQADVPLTELAQRIEAQFPELGERLLTVVSLIDGDSSSGSPQLFASLARETEQRSLGMDFARAVPARPVIRFAITVGVLAVVTTAMAAVLPGSGEQLRRVGMPWHRPTAVVPFRILVTSGDPLVRRGGPVTLSAYLEPVHSAVDLPESAVLVFRSGPDAHKAKLPMTGDRTATFHVTRPNVMTDFEYWVEAGRAVSDRHIVQVADAVDLTTQSSVEIAPPLYAGGIPARTTTGLADLAGLQHSIATLRFQFDRPAGVVTLDWRPENQGTAGSSLVPVELTPDRTGATATVLLKENGTLRLCLATEPGSLAIKTETLIPVRVTIDTPPRFEQVSGVTILPRAVRPGERVQVALVAVDNLGVGSAEIEYLNSADPGKTARISIPLIGAGTTRAEGRATLDLTGLGSEGETIQLRVRVADTRRVDNPRLGPQEALYPPRGWSELKLSASAPPLDEQDILSQRDVVRQGAVAAKNVIDQTLVDVRTLAGETAGRSPLPLDHAVRLQAARDRLRVAVELLHEAAQDAALTPDLRSLATALRDITDIPIREAADSLQKAATDNPRDREAAITLTDARLTDTAGRLDGVIRWNDRLAQDRLARRRLDALAADQKALADRVTTEAALPPTTLRSQEALLTRLARILADSPALESGADTATRQEARRLAADAQALAVLLRELNSAIAGLSADLRRSLLDELTRSHSGVVDRAAGVFARIDTAARIGRISLPAADALRRATDLLASDRTVGALTELEKLTQSLERTAGEFEKWAAEREDPKVAARQFALWQDDLRTRFVAAPFDRRPAPAQAAFRAEQRAILRATERLRLPPDSEVTSLRDAGLTHLRLAAECVDDNGIGAEQAMRLAAEALTRLADKTLSVPDRLARTRRELDTTRADQDAIITTAESVLLLEKQVPDAAVQLALARKLKGVMEKQTKLADRFAALDLPGLESRQAQVLSTLRSVIADMTAGRPLDSLASLAAAKRDLDRLRQVVGGQRPVDDTAIALAHLQQDINATLSKLGASPTAKTLEPLLAIQKDLAFELVRFSSPEAPSLLHDAQQAARLAEAGFREGSKPDELRRRVGAAADALTRLADRLTGRETDRDRVKRLMENRLRAGRLPPGPIATPPEQDASGEERRRLAREAEELSHTRVGGAGQPIKRRVLDLYARLQTRSDPDRAFGEQKQLADALLDLARNMPEDKPQGGRLGAGVGEPEPSDAYLPSVWLANQLRGLVRDVQDGRDRLNGLATEVITRTRPSPTNPLAGLEERQRSLSGAIVTLSDTLFASQDAASSEAGRAAGSARSAADRMRVGKMRVAREAGEATARRLHALATSAGSRPWGKIAAILATRQEEILTDLAEIQADPAAVAAQQNASQRLLAKKATELAKMLDQAAQNTPLDDPVRKALGDAARLVQQSETALVAASQKTVEGAMSEAARLRGDAEDAFQRAVDLAEGIGGPNGPPDIDLPAIESGKAVRQAAAAMRRAAAALGSDSNPTAVGLTMREAAEALHRAAVAVWAGPNPLAAEGSARSRSN